MKDFLYLILPFLIISCSETKKEYAGKKPYIILELQNNKGKEIIIECPKRFKSQKIIATNGKHFLDFEIGDLIYIYDSKNKDYRSMNGSKIGSLIKILKEEENLSGDYNIGFENLEISKDQNDLAINQYIKSLEKPYSKLWQIPNYPFNYKLYENGIREIRKINDSILKTDISNEAKLNILLESLSWKFLNKKRLAYYLSNDIDTLKVSKPLLEYFNERKSFALAGFGIGDTLPMSKLISSNKNENIDLNTLEKKINILFFTAKWCGNCKRYIEPLKNIQTKYSKDVDIFAINFDDNEKVYLKYQEGLNFKFVSELVTMENSLNGKNFNVNSLPNLIIIDHNKKVLLNMPQSNLLEYQIKGILQSTVGNTVYN
jgi:thiol-disulfide isomerase/thioredoxin